MPLVKVEIFQKLHNIRQTKVHKDEKTHVPLIGIPNFVKKNKTKQNKTKNINWKKNYIDLNEPRQVGFETLQMQDIQLLVQSS